MVNSDWLMACPKGMLQRSPWDLWHAAESGING